MCDEETKDSTEEIIASLRKGKKLHDHFAEQFRNKYLVAGKLMKEWKEHFLISIPPDLNPQTCQQLDLRIIEMNQEASFLKAEADARLTAAKGAGTDRYREKMTALVAQYREEGKKLPASATLSALADDSISNIKNTIVHAEIELNFWKDILTNIASARKSLKNITINLGIEAKALQQEGILNSLNRNSND